MSECDCGPWITLSMCGIGTFDPETSELRSVRCPDRLCAGLVPLIDGRIADHDGILPSALRCPWIGVRVVDDTAELMPDFYTRISTQVLRP
ncbi:hypothetical protein AB0M12_36825 [Nocardia vinacea]|uniref:hypothetical protein n=1 Tax=Nocardia vinacea TaxID=96468 RepID=UPI003416572D